MDGGKLCQSDKNVLNLGIDEFYNKNVTQKLHFKTIQYLFVLIVFFNKYLSLLSVLTQFVHIYFAISFTNLVDNNRWTAFEMSSYFLYLLKISNLKNEASELHYYICYKIDCPNQHIFA